MTLTPVKDIKEYKRVKEALRDEFVAERTGDQELFRAQSKKFQALIDTQQQTVKEIKDINSTAVSNALLPFTKELQRRNEQVDMLAEQPFFHHEVPLDSVRPQAAISPISSAYPMNIDLDAPLNETDRKNLKNMRFELPSIVFRTKTKEPTLAAIKTKKRSIYIY